MARFKGIGLGLLLAACGGPMVQAEDEQAMNRVSFQVSVNEEVDNDRLTVTLRATEEGSDPAAVADAINQKTNWALEKARNKDGMEVRSAGYSTSPVYDKARIRRWRAQQDVLLEGSDFAAITKLVGTLQEQLNVTSLHFSVSDERRAEVEARLISAAIKAFRARAKAVASGFDAGDYKLVLASIDTSGGNRPVRHMRAHAEGLVSSSAVSAPDVEAGTSSLRVSVHGSIELD